MGSILTAKWLHLIITGVSGTIMTAQQIPFLSSTCVCNTFMEKRNRNQVSIIVFVYKSKSYFCT